MRIRRAMALCVLLLAGAAAAPAQASPAETRARNAALQRAKQGWTYFGTGRYEEALKAFREAESTVHAPTFLIMVARSQDKLGRLLEARTAYQAVVDDKLPHDAPAPFKQAQAEARTELAAIGPRIPTVEISVTGTDSATARVSFDGAAVQQLTPIEGDPGRHTVVALVPGRRMQTKSVVLKEGARAQVAFRLDIIVPPSEKQAKAASPKAALQRSEEPKKDEVPASPPDDGSSLGRRSTAIVVGGIAATAVGATLGVVFAVTSNAKADDQQKLLPSGCGDPARCPGLDLAEYNRLGHGTADLANASVWSFAAAGALGLGTAAYFLLTRAPESHEASQTSVSVMAWPGGLVIRKRW